MMTMMIVMLLVVAGLPLTVAALFAGLAQGRKNFCVPEFGKTSKFKGASFPKTHRKAS